MFLMVTFPGARSDTIARRRVFCFLGLATSKVPKIGASCEKRDKLLKEISHFVLDLTLPLGIKKVPKNFYLVYYKRIASISSNVLLDN